MTCRCAPNARCGRCVDARLSLSIPPRFGKMRAYRERQASHRDNLALYPEDEPNHFVAALRYVWLHINEPQWRPYEPSAEEP